MTQITPTYCNEEAIRNQDCHEETRKRKGRLDAKNETRLQGIRYTNTDRKEEER